VSRSNLIEQIAKNKSTRTSHYQKAHDEELLIRIKEIVKERPSYGYRRVAILLRSQLHTCVNHKCVYRIMKQNNLLLQKPCHRSKRLHDGKVETLHSNTRWCSDTFSIQCWNGERVHVAFSIDSCDREVMRYIASTIGINGKAIRDLMIETVEYRIGRSVVPFKIQWLSDNASCYTARETVAFGKSLGLDIRTTLPYSPESNGLAEAFVKTFKRDYVYFGGLSNAKEVMKQLPKWMEDYNERAPHKALKMLSPREFIREQKRVS
jgi:putative transposase